MLDGKPLLSDRDLAQTFNRLVVRLSSFRAEESMVTITPEFAAHVHALHVKKDIGKKLTGDRTLLLMPAMLSVCRDLAREEVTLNLCYTVIPLLFHHYSTIFLQKREVLTGCDVE